MSTGNCYCNGTGDDVFICKRFFKRLWIFKLKGKSYFNLSGASFYILAVRLILSKQIQMETTVYTSYNILNVVFVDYQIHMETVGLQAEANTYIKHSGSCSSPKVP